MNFGERKRCGRAGFGLAPVKSTELVRNNVRSLEDFRLTPGAGGLVCSSALGGLGVPRVFFLAHGRADFRARDGSDFAVTR